MSTKEELTENISRYLAQKIKAEDKSTFRALAELVTLLSSVAALIGAGIALYTSNQSLGVQSKLDRNQVFLNENDMIGSLYYQRYQLKYKEHDQLPNLSCITIPLSDTNKWNKYYQCLHGIELPKNDVSFKNVSNVDRLKCMIEKVEFCRIENPKSTHKEQE